MRISHSDAITLEGIVREVFSCERGGMGGYIDADHFEREPFDAALIALAPLWEKATFKQVEDFLYKWEGTLRSTDKEEPQITNTYICELRTLIEDLNRF